MGTWEDLGVFRLGLRAIDNLPSVSQSSIEFTEFVVELVPPPARTLMAETYLRKLAIYRKEQARLVSPTGVPMETMRHSLRYRGVSRSNIDGFS